jgi:poly(3-hydroxybutyrate) depolymerase
VVPAIVFHGGRDTTVNPRNSDAVIRQLAKDVPLRTRVENGCATNGHGYQRTLYSDARGTILMEKWIVQDGGHAWFGGSPAGTYTDPKGPDATNEMLRFFMAHPQDRS